jgi:two-component system chemotaxis response regulator CheB
MIRVLIADDSLSVRKMLRDILEYDAGISVVAEAENGKKTIAEAKRLHPDVILMDIVMPVVSGIDAIAQILATCPCPIVVVSSTKERESIYQRWDAIMAGAVANIEKMDYQADPEKWERELIRTVKAATRVRVKSRRRRPVVIPHDKQLGRKRQQYDLVTFGVSTGGPGVIAGILRDIPRSFNLPILLVIHLAESQGCSFVNWLDGNCHFKVRLATGNELLAELGGQVLVAPPQKHMIVRNGRVLLTDEPPVNFCRPSVDVLFDSLARERASNIIGILLTGMGRDGANGLKALKENGAFTICQDESSSVVFGMPKAAISIDAAETVLSADMISEKIVELTDCDTTEKGNG